ncbi:hypothetical protein ACM39_12645 [Chryseobacterium sp. FH2]|uniref:class I lanthipeptide n=1 Tax=Chryseobacterium sp. FH2 TaxID=1674291 RepID=UPI00065AD772|nr:class I lanthipeptide [Chryseobacterium sp. FH2]KMQ67696.1 hypothetical protein ACM39_12645 [Chryseobacterium sp. FH2]
MKKKKLTLNKQKITKLTADQSASVQGGLIAGGSGSSSWNDFTCCLCTNGGDGPSKSTNKCPDPMPGSAPSEVLWNC